MRPQTITWIDAEIADYHNSKEQLRVLESELAYPSPVLDPTGIHAEGWHSDLTNRAVALVQNRERRELMRSVRGVGKLLRALDAPEKQALALVYWQDMPTERVGELLRTPGRTVRHWRHNWRLFLAREWRWE